MPTYRSPPLNLRVRLRNPSERPLVIRNAYGGIVSETEWGSMVWASRRDMIPRVLIEATQKVFLARVSFTVRHRANVAPDVEIVHDAEVFQSVGPPSIRGGAGARRASRYLEITCERRA